MDKLYTVILHDGTIIEGLGKNGDNYISKKELSPDIFNENLIEVVEVSDDKTEHYHMMKLAHLTKTGDEWWFSFIPLNNYELLEIKIKSDIEYIAMMTDINI